MNDPRDWILVSAKLMLPTEAEAFLGSPGMEFWISPAACDEGNGNSNLDGSEDLLPQELEEGKEEEGAPGARGYVGLDLQPSHALSLWREKLLPV